MKENAVLILFLATPVLLLVVLIRFFRQGEKDSESSWRRLAAGNVLIFGFMISCAFLGGEIYYRFLYDKTEAFGLTKTTKIWFKRYYHKNYMGIRDSISDYPRRAQRDRPRFSFLGDSFTVGHGVRDVEKRFVNLIRNRRPDWEVHLFAQNGDETAHAISRVQAIRRSGYQIDRVLLVYCLNDISDIVSEWLRVHSKLYSAPRPGFLIHNSYFLNFRHWRWRVNRDPDLSQYFSFLKDAYENEIWEKQKRRLERLHDLVSAQGGTLQVVTFPFLHNLGPDYSFAASHKRLADFWKDLGVPTLDLLAVYSPHYSEGLVVGPNDAHPNEHAHKIAAEAIEKFMEETL